MSDGRRPAQREDRHLPLWEALLLTGLRAASRPLARRHRGRAARRGAFLLPRPHLGAHIRAVTAVSAALLLGVVAALQVQPSLGGLSAPPVPASEQVCGSSSLNGPSSAPGGAVTVAAGDNSGVTFTTPGATYWFAAGTHTLGSSQFSQIDPGSNSVFTGAPGAIINGQNLNQFAFAGNATGVTVEYLTIENFVPPGAQGAVNINGEPNWTVANSTLKDNLPGAGMMLGTNSAVTGDCLTHNGEYGFNGYSVNDVSPLTSGPSNVTLTGNEISFNDTCNWEVDPAFPITPPAGCTGAGQFLGCGCSGGGKFWEVNGATIANNYVHDNYSVGLWADTNNTGFAFTSNYISGNASYGIIYEISYNALFNGNVFSRNAILDGPENAGFPESGIYISESGSDSRVPGAYGGQFSITNNQFFNNWGGVILWENSNRFCTSTANSSTGTCTLVAPGEANYTTCQTSLRPPSLPVRGPMPPSRRSRGSGGGATQGQGFQNLINAAPYIDDCRWKTQNVKVSGNLFDYNPADVSATCTVANYCGFNGLFSEYGTYPPYVGYYVPNNITFNQNDLFTGNVYCGPWGFDPYQQGNQFSFATWQGSPYDQDPGSTLNGPGCSPQPPVQPGPQNRAVTVPIYAGRR